MSKTSAIKHLPNMSLVIIRQDYLALVNKLDVAKKKKDKPDHQCTSAIMNVFEHWTNVKMANRSQAQIQNEIDAKAGETASQDTGLWIFKTKEELTYKDLMGTWGLSKVSQCTTWLVSKKILIQRKNPKYKWDKTLQYKLDVDLLNRWLSELTDGELKFNESRKKNQRIDIDKINDAIPESSSEGSSESSLPDVAGGDDFNGFNPDDADMVMRKLNGYAEKDFTIAIETIWLAHNKTGATPIDDEMAKAMFTDDEYLEVIASAKHQYNARINGLAKLVSELPEITPKSERDELAAHTMGLVQREKERQAKIKAKADKKAQSDNAYDLSQVIPELLNLHNGRAFDIGHMLSGKDTRKIKGLAQYFEGDKMVSVAELAGAVELYKRTYPDLQMMQSPDVISDFVGKYRVQKIKVETMTGVTQDRIKQMNLMNVHAPPPGE